MQEIMETPELFSGERSKLYSKQLEHNGTKIFFHQIESVAYPDNEYKSKTSTNVFVSALFARYLTANSFLGGHLRVCFRKIIFVSHEPY